MYKSVLDVQIGDALAGDLEGVVVEKFNTMGMDRSRMVALVLDTADGPRDVQLPITALTVVKASA